MNSVCINNFCDSSPVEVNAGEHSTCGQIVSIRQNMGSCHFQHSMRPDQARAMAAALIAGAEEMEALFKAAP